MRAVRGAGALLAVAAAAWLALVEVFWVPLRLGGVLVPVSVVAAVVGNLVLVDAAHRLSGSRVVAALPALVWAVVALAAATRRPEGDLVIPGGGALGGVGLAFLMAGTLSAVLAVGRAVTAPRGGAVSPAPATARREPAGSGSGGAR